MLCKIITHYATYLTWKLFLPKTRGFKHYGFVLQQDYFVQHLIEKIIPGEVPGSSGAAERKVKNRFLVVLRHNFLAPNPIYLLPFDPLATNDGGSSVNQSFPCLSSLNFSAFSQFSRQNKQ